MANRFLNNIKINDSYTLPPADGTADQIIKTDGLGQLSFIDQSDVAADKANSVILRVKNSTTSAMSKGQVICEAVSLDPPSGNLIEVELADNTGTNTMPALGILNDDLDAAGGNNDEGDAIMFGKVSGIDTSAFSVGDEVFVDDTPGGLTTTKPTGVKYIQKVGVVIRDDDTNGTIEVFGAGRTNDVPTPLYIDHPNQRVGIGNPDPSYLLDINEDDNAVALRVTGGGGGAAMATFVRDVGDTGSQVNINAQSNFPQIQFVNTGNTFSIGGDTSGNFKISDNTSIGANDRITIDSTGNVGIGATNLDYKLDVAGNARFTGEINMQEDHYVNLRFNIPPNNNNEQYILLCRYAANNDVNGTITMDRTSSLRHACSVDIVLSAGSVNAPVGGLRSVGTAGAGNPKYNLVTCYLDGIQYVALKIENPDNFYESSGAYFTGRITSTGDKLVPKLASELTSIVDFEANTLHAFSGDAFFRDGDVEILETAKETPADKFVVLDSGVLKYRTGAEVLSDIGGSSGSLQLIDVSEPGNTTAEWSLIKTLPATTDSTRDTLFIKVVGGSWNDEGRFEAEITLSNRDGFNYFWEVKGGDEYNINANGSNRLRVIAYSQTDGTVDVYLYKVGYMTGYIYATFQNTGGPEIITSLGSPTTTQPSGTEVFNTHGETYSANISSVNGKVGINAAYPGKMLELRGGENEAAIRLRDTGSNVWDIQNSTLGKLDFIRGGSSTYMRIDQFGNVGIGTTDPASQLHVRNDDAETATAAGITVEQDGTGDAIVQYLLTGVKRWTTGIDNSDGDKFKISQNADLGSDNVMTFDTAGKVGIGTAQPNAKLEVDSDDAFKTVQLTGTSPAIYFNEDDSASTDNWHLGVNGGALYFLRDTDKNGAYNNIAAYFSGNNLISEGNFYAKGNTFSFGASTSEGEYITRSGNDIRFIAGGDTRMTVDGDGGYIGIKTTDPQYSLDVNDDKQRFGENSKLFLAKASSAFPSYSDINTESAFISHNSGTSRAVTMGVSDDSNIAAYVHINELNSPGTSFVSIGTNTQERLRVKADGNVGIGTDNPNHELVVQGTSSPNIELKNSNYSDGGFVLNRTNYTQQWKWWAQNSQMYFSFATDESTYSPKITIQADGDVGIGVTVPQAKLEVEQTNSSASTVFLSNSYNNKGFRTGHAGYATFSGYQDGNDTTFGSSYGALIGLNTFYNGTSFYNDNQYVDPSSILFKDGNILFYTNDISAYGNFTPNERLRINKGGNVGIGTDNPGEKLDVAGDIKSTGSIYTGYNPGVANSISCSNWFRTSGTTGIFFASYQGGLYMTDTTYVRLYNSKALQVDNASTSSIRAAGDIVAYYSDERLKTNLGNITNAVDKVKKLNGFYYKNNELANSFGYTEDHLQVGVSAQEVEAIMPEVVKPAPFDFKTKENGEGYSASGENYKTVKYEKLVPLLIEAIKEQQKQIDELKNQLDAFTK